MTATDALLADIDAMFAETASLTGRAALSPRVRQALIDTPRELFTPAAQADLAHVNAPLPIGFGQTISQPFVVALMTELLDLTSDMRVLEIGVGSGYQTALLSPLVERVYGVERLAALAERAGFVLRRLARLNVELKVGDGAAGWPEHAPFDVILAAAAAAEIPPALTAQLRPGGRMVIPVGPAGGAQSLELVARQIDGSLVRRAVLPVSFVPLVRDGVGQR